MKRMRALAAFGFVAAVAAAQADSAAPNLVGGVSLSPARPGPQRPGDSPEQPYAAATVLLRDSADAVTARATTDERGRFAMRVAPGRYHVVIDTQGAVYPHCDPASVTVRPDQVASVEVRCDSGMR